MRGKPLFVVLGLVIGSACFAQTAPTTPPAPAPESEEAPAKFQTTVTGNRASPARTQDRVFAGTRFWLLDPGEYEVEVWASDKFKRDHTDDGLLQVEVEIGLAPHLQLDLYQNFSFGTGGFAVEGNQLELRIAFGRDYNQIPLNPVLYLEWHPRKSAQDRAEVRLLLGGDLSSRFVWAANLFFEGNIDDFDQPGSEGADLEVGATGAVSFSVIEDIFRVGAEVKFGADEHGGPSFEPMALIGPNILLKAKRLGLKLTATLLVGLMPRDPRLQPFIIAGWQF